MLNKYIEILEKLNTYFSKIPHFIDFSNVPEIKESFNLLTTYGIFNTVSIDVPMSFSIKALENKLSSTRSNYENFRICKAIDSIYNNIINVKLPKLTKEQLFDLSQEVCDCSDTQSYRLSLIILTGVSYYQHRLSFDNYKEDEDDIKFVFDRIKSYDVLVSKSLRKNAFNSSSVVLTITVID